MTEDELQSIRKEMIDKCNSLFKLGTIRINSYDYNIFFGTSSLYLHKDVCFARADDRVAEKYNNNYSTFYYVLRPYSELYDAGLVIDSLRDRKSVV